MFTKHRIRTFSWHIVDQFLVIGAPKLIILPLLAAKIGSRDFGIFVLAMTAIQVVGLSPSNGFQGWMLRDLERYDEVRWNGLAGWACVWSLVVASPFAVAALTGPMWANLAFEEQGVGQVILALTPYLLASNAFETGLTRLRVRRRLAEIAAWHALNFTCITVALLVMYDASAVGAAHGFSVGATATAVLTFAYLAADMRKIPRRLRRFARGHALSIWWPMSLSALLGLTAYSIDRLLVGIWLTAESVAVYFAAASLASLAAAPFGLLGGWVTTMLGKASGGRDRVMAEWYRVAPLLLAAIAITSAMFVGLGEIILEIFYPELKEAALSIWWLLVIASGLRAVFVIVRPIVVKFGSPRLLPVLTMSTLTIKILLLILLVPMFALSGAATASLGASAAVIVIWWIVMMMVVRHPDPASAGRSQRTKQNGINSNA